MQLVFVYNLDEYSRMSMSKVSNCLLFKYM